MKNNIKKCTLHARGANLQFRFWGVGGVDSAFFG
jgi:hypothetical protein